MVFRKLIVLFICVFGQLSQSNAAEQNQKVETLVMFFHGMGQRAQDWQMMYEPIKEMYKGVIPDHRIKKGTVVVDFPEGSHDYQTRFSLGMGKQWFILPSTFKQDAQGITTEEGLIAYLDPRGSGLMDSATVLIAYINNLLDHYELTTDNLVLMGYSQGGMIASMVSQHMDGDCRALVMINAPYVPGENGISKAQQAYLTYGTRDQLIPQHVYEISIEALKRHLGEDKIVVNRIDGVRHDPDMVRQAPFVFDLINTTLKEIKIMK